MNVPQPRTDRSRTASRDGATDPGSPPDAALDNALQALATPVAMRSSSRRDVDTVLRSVQLARARRRVLLRAALAALSLLVVGILIAWRLVAAQSTARTEHPATRVTAMTTPTPSPAASGERAPPGPVASTAPVSEALPVAALATASAPARPAPAPAPAPSPVRANSATPKPPVSSLPSTSDLPEGP